ncbi:DNA polymerase-4 [Haloechinothrix alba]|uniref:DNA polymerase IV n=1 Tax=Haloechinothrix alba TaxID=664784 RepID=A0A238WG44_9PSEU|nr:DNA polymerase IV [Haloechinothrix alba]SNR45263.1 DNA polymerase-4 [Haloechinothrix alba]
MGRSSELHGQSSRFRLPRGGDDAGPLPDDTGCGVLHVDMDAFFAAVELRAYPELVAEPVVVAGSSPRSVVMSANYPAREYGIRSAMPVAQARRLCPRATFLTPTRGAYSEVSAGVMAVFRELTPQVEPLSLDEAFLDVSGALRRLNSTPAGIAADIRARVVAEFGITCSVGIAPVKFLAKLASGLAKPDGTVVVPSSEVLDFLHPLPVSALWGVGGRTRAALERAGISTIGDVAATPVSRLKRAVGVAAAEQMHALASGHDPRPVTPDSVEKSFGAEHTFDTDQDDPDVLYRELLRLSEKVAAGIRAKRIRARTVSIKVRFADFTTITRSRSLVEPTDVSREIHGCARALFIQHTPSNALVRLLGVRVEGLVSEDDGEQLSFTSDVPRWRDAEVAADGARSRFGAGAVYPASLLPPESSEGSG